MHLMTYVNDSSSTKVKGNEFSCSPVFKHLGSAIASDG